MGRKSGNTIRSATKRKTRKSRKEKTQKDSKSFKARMDDSTEKPKRTRLPRKKRTEQERLDRAAEKAANLEDGANKGHIYTKGASFKTKPLPKSNKDSVTEAEIHRPELMAGGYSATLLKKGGPSKTKLPESFQDIHLKKAIKKGEKLDELPTDPEQIHARAVGLKKKPSLQDKARRCPLANYSE